ncbi:MAG: hypothetical protein ORO03_07985 [Alphaproteobacteria bacterium]|nr:hypothetical protein [Alphaproteobacteria bacterium]
MITSGQSSSPLTCPGCGLGCDDLSWEMIEGTPRVNSHGCPIADDYFKPPAAAVAPHLVRGQAVELGHALKAATEILASARMPVFIGPGGDIAAMQSLLALADQLGGVVDSRSRIVPINMQVMQDSGLIASTFSEVYNRADLVLLVGGNPVPNWPRLLPRLMNNPQSMFRQAKPRVIHLGTAIEPSQLPAGLDYQSIACSPAEILGTVAALTTQFREDWRAAAPFLAAIASVGETISAADYPVVIWDASNLCPTPAESVLAIDLVGEMIRFLSQKQRIVGMPLGGSDNAGGMASVMTWQTGFPNRLFYSPQGPETSRYRDQGLQLVAQHDAAVLVWVSTILPYPPPEFAGKTIAIVADDFPEDESAKAEVVLRVGRLGIDHSGEFGRSDSVVMVPVPAAYPRERPRCDSVLDELLAGIKNLKGVRP